MMRKMRYAPMFNAENLDVQYQKDLDNFDRRAAGIRALACQSYHHNGPPILTQWEQGHIAGKGKGKSEFQPEGFDSALVSGGSVERPSSAPRQRPPHQSEVRKQQGQYNPITHDSSRDREYEARREKEFRLGPGGGGPRMMEGGGGGRPSSATRRVPESLSTRAAFDPILGKACPPSSAPPATPPHGGATPPSGRSALGSAIPAERPATPGRRTRIENGDSWGTYNPLTHEYSKPPKDARFFDQEAVTTRTQWISGQSKGRVAMKPDQGVYNPIANKWIVPPQNTRIIPGLSFAPAGIFSKTSGGLRP